MQWQQQPQQQPQPQPQAASASQPAVQTQGWTFGGLNVRKPAAMTELMAQGKDGLQRLQSTLDRHVVDAYTRIVEKRFIDGRVTWFDDPKRDFVFLVKNEHPLVGICTASHKHPFSRSERLWNLVFCLFLSFFTASVVQSVKSGCDDPADGAQADLARHNYDQCVADADTDSLYVSVAFGALVAVAGMVHRSAAECACAARQRLFVVRNCCEAIGRCCVYCGAGWAFVFLLVGIIILATTPGVNGGFFVANFALSQGTSWCLDFPILALKFVYRRRSEQDDDDAKRDYAIFRKCFEAEKQKHGANWKGHFDPAADVEGGVSAKGHGALSPDVTVAPPSDGPTTTGTVAMPGTSDAQPGDVAVAVAPPAMPVIASLAQPAVVAAAADAGTYPGAGAGADANAAVVLPGIVQPAPAPVPFSAGAPVSTAAAGGYVQLPGAGPVPVPAPAAAPATPTRYVDQYGRPVAPPQGMQPPRGASPVPTGGAAASASVAVTQALTGLENALSGAVTSLGGLFGAKPQSQPAPQPQPPVQPQVQVQMQMQPQMQPQMQSQMQPQMQSQMQPQMQPQMQSQMHQPMPMPMPVPVPAHAQQMQYQAQYQPQPQYAPQYPPQPQPQYVQQHQQPMMVSAPGAVVYTNAQPQPQFVMGGVQQAPPYTAQPVVYSTGPAPAYGAPVVGAPMAFVPNA